MTREIKFRAWTKRDKCWCFGFAIHKSGLWRESPKDDWIDLSKQDDIILMQFTGLKDKNGKEIYEGDIVRYEIEKIGLVAWEDNGFWIAEGDKRYWPNHQEIIGNIHETPELLR